MFANRMTIERVNLDGSGFRALVNGTNNTVALDYDVRYEKHNQVKLKDTK